MIEISELKNGQSVWRMVSGKLGEYEVVAVGRKALLINRLGWNKTHPDNPLINSSRYYQHETGGLFATPQEAYAYYRQGLVKQIEKAKIALMSFECHAQERGWVVTARD